MKPNILMELGGVAWAAIVSPFHALFSPFDPDETTMTITLSRPVPVTRSALYAALESPDASQPPGVDVKVISADHPQRYLITLPGGDTLDMTIIERVENQSMKIDVIITDASPHRPSDVSRMLETFEIIEREGSLALNFVQVLLFRKKTGRLARSYSKLLITHFQRMRLDHLISIAATTHGTTNQ